MIEALAQTAGSATPEPWFDPQLFGTLYGAIAGGIGGSFVGILAAVAGTLAPAGRARGFVLGAFRTSAAVGFCSLAFGVYALASGQPRGIWYAPILVGVLLGGIPLFLIPVVKKRYAAADGLRRG